MRLEDCHPHGRGPVKTLTEPLLGKGVQNSDRDLRSDLHHPLRRDPEIGGGIVGVASKRDEELVLPVRHGRLR